MPPTAALILHLYGASYANLSFSLPLRGRRLLALPARKGRAVMESRNRSPFPSIEVLLVEDSPVQTEYLRSLLARNGFAVTTAGNGREGLELLLQRPAHPWVVLSDILMPELDGYELCRSIRSEESLAATPVILLTSLQSPTDVIRGLECGADNFLVKPAVSG